MRYINVVKQELKEGYIRQTLENGDVRNVPYSTDKVTGEKYCETDPELIKVAIH